MALTAADIETLDRAIASGVLVVRAADGSSVTYRTMEDLLRARSLAAGQVGAGGLDPAQQPGGPSYAEWSRD